MTGAFLAADLVNLAHRHWSRSALLDVLTTHEIRRREVTESGSMSLRDWTGRLRRVFDSGEADTRCTAINDVLDAAVSRVYVTTHNELRPHLHFVSDELDVVARVRAVTAGGLAMFLVEAGGERLGRCGRDGCGLVFVDTSRNGRRAYCSARCGNAVAVARHRGRVVPKAETESERQTRANPGWPSSPASDDCTRR